MNEERREKKKKNNGEMEIHFASEKTIKANRKRKCNIEKKLCGSTVFSVAGIQMTLWYPTHTFCAFCITQYDTIYDRITVFPIAAIQ